MMMFQVILVGVLTIFSWDLSDARKGRKRGHYLPDIDLTDQPVDGAVQLRLNSTIIPGQNVQLLCVANVSEKVQFQWTFHHEILEQSKRIKLQYWSRYSSLTIRKVEKSDTGLYKCFAKSNDSINFATLFVDIKPKPELKLTPRSAIIEGGKSIVLQCQNLKKNSTISNITISRKSLPGGPWRDVVRNKDSYTWTANIRHYGPSNYRVFDFTCNGKTIWERIVRSVPSRITVIKPGSLTTLGSCPAEVAEGIQWQRTILGMVDTQACYNDTGEATRLCESFPGRPPHWRRPDLKHCSSPLFTFIEDEIDALDEGFDFDLNITSILTELSGITRISHGPKGHAAGPGRLFGKDLLSSVGILRRTKDFVRMGKHPGQVAKESFLPFAETASNLLDVKNLNTWEDIDEENPDTAVELITALEEFGFDLEDDLSEDSDNLNEAKEQNLVFQVRHITPQSELRKNGLIFQQNKSLIRLPPSVFNERSSVTVVSVIYNTLSSILSILNVSRNMEDDSNSSMAALLGNSTIISSTVKPVGSEKFRQPVKIVLEHNITNVTDSLRKRCVFWEPEKEDSRWNDEGCHVVTKESNEYVTTCECDHLTLFAVMVNLDSSSMKSSDSATLDVISTIGSAISLASVTLTIIIYVALWKTLKSPRVVNLLNLCVAIGLLDVFSIIRAPYQDNEDMCRAIGILLHLFLMALFFWMLCEGILLYLMMTNIFKRHYGKKWYLLVCMVGWGIPALIVAISVGIVGTSQYGRVGNCWLARENQFIWAALGPLVVVLLVNFVVFGVMMCHVLSSRKIQEEDTAGKIKASLRASIVILPILGFTWTFAVLDFLFDEVALKYMFAIFNSLQGFFIFLFHCLFNNQVQQALCKSKKAEGKGILDRVKTNEMHMKDSLDSLH